MGWKDLGRNQKCVCITESFLVKGSNKADRNMGGCDSAIRRQVGRPLLAPVAPAIPV
jgi:hypothetical protein